ncbi:CDP-diacylglycerol--glycerol-3-phosphate 3-phosphatidyltransferase [Candidatus Woesearchaeota archaeon CG_4_10_14_0_2_um_filter_33_13]|nr:MAG: CDP-diacylglycerol--glycerol-3-phosphate 3-phosphatidyltransferase [Candidatus Woesearchaeota archaeon CG_4_10_14_0_2_um_filter_33_13]
MNLPNKITLLRILFIPIFVFILYLNIPYKDWIATGVFVLLALTDSLDGYLARKRNQITTFGKFIDPLADKLLVTAALVFLIGHGVEAWMAYVIIAREFLVMGVRIIAIQKNVVIKASSLGKLKTVSQVIAVIAAIMALPLNWWFMLIATLFTIISGLDYFLAAKKLLED